MRAMRVLCLAVAVAAADALDALDDLDARGPTRAAAVGCFYVWQPNLRYRSGGALVMHQLAGALRRQGACVRMAYVHPRLASHVGADAGAVNLSEAEVSALFAEGIGPEDALVSTEVAPEFALVEDDAHVPHSAGVSSEDSVAANVRAVERRGGVVARWMLAAARDWGDRVEWRVSTHFGLSRALHRAFAGSGPERQIVPVDDEVLAYYAEWQSMAAELKANEKRRGDVTLVMYDDDMSLEADDLQRALEQEWARARVALPPPRALRFAGFSRNETRAIFRRTAAFVDTALPGLEAAVWEFALFDAAPVLASWDHGTLGGDFDDRLTRVDNDAAEAIARGVVDALWRRPPPADAMEALRRGAVDARRRLDEMAASLVTSRRRTYVYAVADAAAWHRLGVLAVSLCVRYPFSKLLVVSTRAEDADDGVAWRRLGLRLREAMRALGVDRRASFAACADCVRTPSDMLAAALGGMEPTRSELVLLAPGAVIAPDEAALDAASDLPGTGCRVGRGFVRCAPGAPARSNTSLARVVALAPAGKPDLGDCAAFLEHALWARLAPTLSPPSRTLFEAECEQTIK